MTSLDVLICTLNKGIVRILDNLLPPHEQIHYIVCFQYTEDRFLELIPKALTEREDLTFFSYQGCGLSANRNYALRHATSDLFVFADDDARFNLDDFLYAISLFEQRKNLDIAFLQAYTYTGKPLKEYPKREMDLKEYQNMVQISAIEMVCRRERIQGRLFFDERFGLGTKFLTCGEEEIWLFDALRMGMNALYVPHKIMETSTLLKQRMIYVDVGVQRAKGAITYYKEGTKAWFTCLRFAAHAACSGYCHFLPLMRHLTQGIRYIQRTKP